MIERLPNETEKAWQAFQDYFAMGVGRSLPQLEKVYQQRTATDRNVPPTKSVSTIEKWSARYKWDERVKAAEKAVEAENLQRLKEEAHKQYLDRIRAFRTAAEQSAVAGIAGASTLARIQAHIAEQAKQLLTNISINDLQELEAIAKVLQTLNNSAGGNATAADKLFDFNAKVQGLNQLIESLDSD